MIAIVGWGKLNHTSDCKCIFLHCLDVACYYNDWKKYTSLKCFNCKKNHLVVKEYITDDWDGLCFSCYQNQDDIFILNEQY